MKADVFSFSILTYIVVTGLRPWPELTVFQLQRAVVAGERPLIPDTVGWPYRDLIERCWRANPADRPTFAQILAAMTKGDFLGPGIDAAAFVAYCSKVTPGLSVAAPEPEPWIPYGDAALSEAPARAGTSFAALMLNPNDRRRDWTFKPKTGGQGRVFRLVRPPTDEVSAAKELNVDNEYLFVREIGLLAQLRHPLVVGLIGYYVPDEHAEIKRTIITEWMPGGSLDGLIWSPQFSRLSATRKMKIIVSIVLGMRYIHACGVMHRDLKPQNILLSQDCEPKIGDLGSARLTDVEASKTASSFTMVYMAPELAWGTDYGREVDVFSFAITLWEILTGERAFADILAAARGNGMVVSRKIDEGARPKLDGKIPKPAQDLMQRCWTKDPKARPTFAQIFEELSQMRYQLLPGVNARDVAVYAASILAFEQAHPPQNLGQDN